MTSEPQTTFVFVRLPATGEVVVAGRYDLSPDGVGTFVYGKSYLAREGAIALDPVHLPLREVAFRTTLNGGLFGVLRDGAPDAWGRRVIERRITPVTELDYLLATSDARVGALSFAPSPEPPALQLGDVLHLDNIAPTLEASDQLQDAIAGESQAIALDPALLDPSSNLGGARPKASVMDPDGQLWVAKFPARRDPWENATVEHACLTLANLCGIRVPSVRLIEVAGRRVLLVKRFDQAPGGVRMPYLSAHTLLGLDSGIMAEDRLGWSYPDLAHHIRALSTLPEPDVHEMYRRIVFNACISNEDDHPRNHALVWEAEGWRLSPAFDLTPSRTRSLDERRFAMQLGRLSGVEPRLMRRSVILSAAQDFLLDPGEAGQIIDEIRERVATQWKDVLQTSGGSAATGTLIEHAFPDAYPGFEYA